MLKRSILTYLCILAAFLILDGIWLGLVAGESYRQAIGHLLREDYPTWPWLVFYLAYVAAILYLAVSVSTTKIQAAARGAVLGIAAYGAYNLTNFSILDTWPLAISLQDWLWGTFLTGASALVGGIVWLRLSPK